MATFTYRARRLDGSSVTGTLPADGERAALAALDRLGLFPLDLRAGPAAAAAAAAASDTQAPARPDPWALLARLRGGIGAETAARFARELADLVQAGVPILRAIDAVAQDPTDQRVIWGARDTRDDARARAVLRDVRRDLAQGSALAQALEQRPELFGRTAVSLIRAGEAGGFLDAALRRVAVFAEREQALARRVKGALTYPALLTVLSAAAVVFLLTWVLPRFSLIYADLGGALPGPTRVLIGVGDALRAHGPLLLVVAVAAAFALGRWLRTPEGRARLDAALLRVPLLRAVIARACLARFARTLGTLLRSGVPILSALEIAKDAAGNAEFTRRIGATLAPLREGAELARPLASTRLFPPQVLEMVQVGQDTGTLADVLERVGERSDEEVDAALRVLVAVFEPALIVGVAGVVFFVVLAALLPIFSLNALVQ